MEGSGEGMIARLKALQEAVTTADGERRWDDRRCRDRLRCRDGHPCGQRRVGQPVIHIKPMSQRPPSPPIQGYRNTRAAQTIQENGVKQISDDTTVQDDRFTSTYQMTHCHVTVSSSPERAAGLPSQNNKYNPYRGNFEVGNCVEIDRGVKDAHTYRSSIIWADRSSPLYAEDVSRGTNPMNHTTGAFVDSPRKYPYSAADVMNSSDIIQGRINYTQAKHSAKLTEHSKSTRSLSRSPEPSKDYNTSRVASNNAQPLRNMSGTIKEYTACTSTELTRPKLTRPVLSDIIDRRSYSLHSRKKYIRGLRYNNDHLNTTLDYLKSCRRLSKDRATEVRYLDDLSKYVKEAIKSCFEDRQSLVCPKLASRYQQHKKYCPKTQRKAESQPAINAQAPCPTACRVSIAVSPKVSTSTLCPALASRYSQHQARCPSRQGISLPQCCKCPSRCACAKSSSHKSPFSGYSSPICKFDIYDDVCPCLPYRNTKVGEIVLEWAKGIPVNANSTPEDKDLREVIIKDLIDNLSVLEEGNFRSDARKEIVNCLDNMPMWYPDKKNKEGFKTQLANNLLNKFDQIKNLNSVIADWVDGLDFKPRDKDGRAINVNKIKKQIIDTLKPIVLNRPSNILNYRNALRSEVRDLLDELPLDDENYTNKCKYRKSLSNNLVDKLVNIPTSSGKFNDILNKLCKNTEGLDDDKKKKLAENYKELLAQGLNNVEVQKSMKDAIHSMKQEGVMEALIKDWLDGVPELEGSSKKQEYQKPISALAIKLSRLKTEDLREADIYDNVTAKVKYFLDDILDKEGVDILPKIKHNLVQNFVDKLKNVAAKQEEINRKIYQGPLEYIKKKVADWLDEIPELSKALEIPGNLVLRDELAKKCANLMKQGLSGDELRNNLNKDVRNLLDSALEEEEVEMETKGKKKLVENLLDDLSSDETVQKLVSKRGYDQESGDHENISVGDIKKVVDQLTDNIPELSSKIKGFLVDKLAKRIPELINKGIKGEALKEVLKKEMEKELVDMDPRDRDRLVKQLVDNVTDGGKQDSYDQEKNESDILAKIKKWTDDIPEMTIRSKKNLANNIANKFVDLRKNGLKGDALKDEIKNLLDFALEKESIELDLDKKQKLVQNLLSELMGKHKMAEDSDDQDLNLDDEKEAIKKWSDDLPNLSTKSKKKIADKLANKFRELKKKGLKGSVLKKLLEKEMEKELEDMNPKVKEKFVRRFLTNVMGGNNGEAKQNKENYKEDSEEQDLDEDKTREAIEQWVDKMPNLPSKKKERLANKLTNKLTDLKKRGVEGNALKKALKMELEKELFDIDPEDKDRIVQRFVNDVISEGAGKSGRNKKKHERDSSDQSLSEDDKERDEDFKKNKAITQLFHNVPGLSTKAQEYVAEKLNKKAKQLKKQGLKGKELEKAIKKEIDKLLEPALADMSPKDQHKLTQKLLGKLVSEPVGDSSTDQSTHVSEINKVMAQLLDNAPGLSIKAKENIAKKLNNTFAQLKARGLQDKELEKALKNEIDELLEPALEAEMLHMNTKDKAKLTQKLLGGLVSDAKSDSSEEDLTLSLKGNKAMTHLLNEIPGLSDKAKEKLAKELDEMTEQLKDQEFKGKKLEKAVRKGMDKLIEPVLRKEGIQMDLKEKQKLNQKLLGELVYGERSDSSDEDSALRIKGNKAMTHLLDDIPGLSDKAKEKLAKDLDKMTEQLKSQELKGKELKRAVRKGMEKLIEPALKKEGIRMDSKDKEKLNQKILGKLVSGAKSDSSVEDLALRIKGIKGMTNLLGDIPGLSDKAKGELAKKLDKMTKSLKDQGISGKELERAVRKGMEKLVEPTLTREGIKMDSKYQKKLNQKLLGELVSGARSDSSEEDLALRLKGNKAMTHLLGEIPGLSDKAKEKLAKDLDRMTEQLKSQELKGKELKRAVRKGMEKLIEPALKKEGIRMDSKDKEKLNQKILGKLVSGAKSDSSVEDLALRIKSIKGMTNLLGDIPGLSDEAKGELAKKLEKMTKSLKDQGISGKELERAVRKGMEKLVEPTLTREGIKMDSKNQKKLNQKLLGELVSGARSDSSEEDLALRLKGNKAMTHLLGEIPGLSDKAKEKLAKELDKMTEQLKDQELKGKELKRAVRKGMEKVIEPALKKEGIRMDSKDKEKLNQKILGKLVSGAKSDSSVEDLALRIKGIKGMTNLLGDIPGLSDKAKEELAKKLDKMTNQLKDQGVSGKELERAVRKGIEKLVEPTLKKEGIKMDSKNQKKLNRMVLFKLVSGAKSDSSGEDLALRIKSIKGMTNLLGDIPGLSNKAKEELAKKLFKMTKQLKDQGVSGKELEKSVRKGMEKLIEPALKNEGINIGSRDKEKLNQKLLDKLIGTEGQDSRNKEQNVDRTPKVLESKHDIKKAMKQLLNDIPGLSNQVKDDLINKLYKKLTHLKKQGLEGKKLERALMKEMEILLEPALEEAGSNLNTEDKKKLKQQLLENMTAGNKTSNFSQEPNDYDIDDEEEVDEQRQEFESEIEKVIKKWLDGIPQTSKASKKKENKTAIKNLGRKYARLTTKDVSQPTFKNQAIEINKNFLSHILRKEVTKLRNRTQKKHAEALLYLLLPVLKGFIGNYTLGKDITEVLPWLNEMHGLEEKDKKKYQVALAKVVSGIENINYYLINYAEEVRIWFNEIAESFGIGNVDQNMIVKLAKDLMQIQFSRTRDRIHELAQIEIKNWLHWVYNKEDEIINNTMKAKLAQKLLCQLEEKSDQAFPKYNISINSKNDSNNGVLSTEFTNPRRGLPKMGRKRWTKLNKKILELNEIYNTNKRGTTTSIKETILSDVNNTKRYKNANKSKLFLYESSRKSKNISSFMNEYFKASCSKNADKFEINPREISSRILSSIDNNLSHVYKRNINYSSSKSSPKKRNSIDTACSKSYRDVNDKNKTCSLNFSLSESDTDSCINKYNSSSRLRQSLNFDNLNGNDVSVKQQGSRTISMKPYCFEEKLRRIKKMSSKRRQNSIYLKNLSTKRDILKIKNKSSNKVSTEWRHSLFKISDLDVHDTSQNTGDKIKKRFSKEKVFDLYDNARAILKTNSKNKISLDADRRTVNSHNNRSTTSHTSVSKPDKLKKNILEDEEFQLNSENFMERIKDKRIRQSISPSIQCTASELFQTNGLKENIFNVDHRNVKSLSPVSRGKLTSLKNTRACVQKINGKLIISLEPKIKNRKSEQMKNILVSTDVVKKCSQDTYYIEEVKDDHDKAKYKFFERGNFSRDTPFVSIPIVKETRRSISATIQKCGDKKDKCESCCCQDIKLELTDAATEIGQFFGSTSEAKAFLKYNTVKDFLTDDIFETELNKQRPQTEQVRSYQAYSDSPTITETFVSTESKNNKNSNFNNQPTISDSSGSTVNKSIQSKTKSIISQSYTPTTTTESSKNKSSQQSEGNEIKVSPYNKTSTNSSVITDYTISTDSTRTQSGKSNEVKPRVSIAIGVEPQSTRSSETSKNTRNKSSIAEIPNKELKKSVKNEIEEVLQKANIKTDRKKIKSLIADLLCDKMISGQIDNQTRQSVFNTLRNANVPEDKANNISSEVMDRIDKVQESIDHNALNVLEQQKADFLKNAEKKFRDFVKEVTGDMNPHEQQKLSKKTKHWSKKLNKVVSDTNLTPEAKALAVKNRITHYLKKTPLNTNEPVTNLSQKLTDNLVNPKPLAEKSSTPITKPTKITDLPRNSPLRSNSSRSNENETQTGTKKPGDTPVQEDPSMFVYPYQRRKRSSSLETVRPRQKDLFYDIIQQWMDELPLIQKAIQAESVRDTKARELTRDIIDRQMYIRSNSTINTNDEIEFEHLKYLVFRWLNKTMTISDLTPFLPNIGDLMIIINRFFGTPPVQPVNSSLINEISKFVEQIPNYFYATNDKNVHDQLAKRVADGIWNNLDKPDADLLIDNELKQWASTMFKSKETDVNKVSEMLKRLLKEKGYLNTKSNDKRHEKVDEKRHEIMDENASMNMTDNLKDIIENWCKNLPIYNGNSSEERENAKIIKISLTSELLKKVGELKLDPEIYEVDRLYDHFLSDIVDKSVDTLPKNPEFEKYLPVLKRDLICQLKELRRKVLRESAVQDYKQELKNTINRCIRLPYCLYPVDMIPFEVLKENMVDAVIALHYSRSYEERIKAKRKMADEISEFCDDYVQRHHVAPCSINPQRIYENLRCTLVKVPVPDDECMRSEVEQVRIKDVIFEWVHDLPLKEAADGELLVRNRNISKLAKSLCEIENEKQYNPNLNSNIKMIEEIFKWLNNAPMEPVSAEYIPRMASVLTDKLAKSKVSRKLRRGISPCHTNPCCYSVSNVKCTTEGTFNPDDKAYLLKVIKRETSNAQCFKHGSGIEIKKSDEIQTGSPNIVIVSHKKSCCTQGTQNQYAESYERHISRPVMACEKKLSKTVLPLMVQSETQTDTCSIQIIECYSNNDNEIPSVPCSLKNAEVQPCLPRFCKSAEVQPCLQSYKDEEVSRIKSFYRDAEVQPYLPCCSQNMQVQPSIQGSFKNAVVGSPMVGIRSPKNAETQPSSGSIGIKLIKARAQSLHSSVGQGGSNRSYFKDAEVQPCIQNFSDKQVQPCVECQDQACSANTKVYSASPSPFRPCPCCSKKAQPVRISDSRSTGTEFSSDEIMRVSCRHDNEPTTSYRTCSNRNRKCREPIYGTFCPEHARRLNRRVLICEGREHRNFCDSIQRFRECTPPDAECPRWGNSDNTRKKWNKNVKYFVYSDD